MSVLFECNETSESKIQRETMIAKSVSSFPREKRIIESKAKDWPLAFGYRDSVNKIRIFLIFSKHPSNMIATH